MKILFATNTYFKDVDFLLTGGFADKYLLNSYNFTAKLLTILNVDNEKKMQAIFSTFCDQVLITSEVAGEVLSFFKLKREDFIDEYGDGYFYSISSFIELYFGKDYDYICHFCGDVELYTKKDWITEGLGLIQNDIVSARPRRPRYVLEEKNPERETQVFSDHCYLIPVKLFRNPEIYQTTSLVEGIHPPYGGRSFERMVTTFLKRYHKYQAIVQSAEVIHPIY